MAISGTQKEVEGEEILATRFRGFGTTTTMHLLGSLFRSR